MVLLVEQMVGFPAAFATADYEIVLMEFLASQPVIDLLLPS
jgi:hypothetical protein